MFYRFISTFGPHRRNDLIPTGLGVEGPGFNRVATIRHGDVVTFTGESRTDIEREWDDDGLTEYELEFREVIVTATGARGFIPFWPFRRDDGTYHADGFEPVDPSTL